jgi:N-methylhydantoinase A/oxoprolinase/acetone carboxylase beta subunit
LISQAHERIICQIADGLLRRAVSEFDLRAANANDRLGNFLIDRSVSTKPRQDPLDANLSITLPIVAIGAPAQAWMPTIAARLHTECEIPKLAHVASAVGASAGHCSEQVEFLLRPLYARSGITGYTVHGPKELRNFNSIMDARAYVQKAGPQLAREQSKISGAIDPAVHQSEQSWDAESDEPSDGGYLMETRFTFTATGQSFR